MTDIAGDVQRAVIHSKILAAELARLRRRLEREGQVMTVADYQRLAEVLGQVGLAGGLLLVTDADRTAELDAARPQLS